MIPDPADARVLRAVYAGNTDVTLAAAWLRTRGIEHAATAARQLPGWPGYAKLSDRERQAVLARFVPAPARWCARCSRSIQYRTGGPDAGWWAHDDDSTWPHLAVPAYTPCGAG